MNRPNIGREMCKAIHIAKKALHVLFIYGKQPIGGSILSCIFVIEAMLVCIANAMSINQLFFSFQHCIFNCQETHQLLNVLSNASYQSFFNMIHVFVLDETNHVTRLCLKFCSGHHSFHLLGRCMHIHEHTLTRMHTCIPLRAQSFRKTENSL